MLPNYENKLNELKSAISDIINRIIIANEINMYAYDKRMLEKYDEVDLRLKNISNDANFIDNEVVKTIALFSPEAQELRELVVYLKITNELVKISDNTKKYSQNMKKCLISECDLLSVDYVIMQLHKTVIDSLTHINNCFSNLESCDVQKTYTTILMEESKNDNAYSILEKTISVKLIDERELAVYYVKLVSTLHKLEKIVDRAVNIANLLVYAKDGGDISLH